MNYQEFVHAVETSIRQRIGANMSVQIHTTLKNNGRERIGIAIQEHGVNISPTIYLEEYYESFQKGTSLDSIVRDILHMYQDVKYDHSWNISELESYQIMKHKILYKVINASDNKAFLKTVPHRLYLDLAIVYYILYQKSELGTATITITHELMNLWKVSFEEICEQAQRNTPILLPQEVKSMNEFVNDMFGEANFPPEVAIPVMYVLSNTTHYLGAASLLYPAVLEDIATLLDENFYILPSSIHEVIIIAESSASSKEGLNEMICDINLTHVSPEEVLSDHAYYYNTKEHRLTL